MVIDLKRLITTGVGYLALKGRIIANDELGKVCKEAVVGDLYFH